MPESEAAPRTDEEEPDGGSVLRSFRKRLSRSGGGSGVSLHIDADLAGELRLDPDTEVTVDVVETDGDVTLRVSDVPAGFSRAALREYADGLGWTETDSYVADDEWSLTYRDPTGLVRVEVDSTTHVDGSVVNNVFVQSEPVDVAEDPARYRALREAADGSGLRVRVRDSEGLWQRLRSSADHDAGGSPDEQTLRQLLAVADGVRVQVVDEMASLNTTLEEVGETVGDVRAVMEEHGDGPAEAGSGPEG